MPTAVLKRPPKLQLVRPQPQPALRVFGPRSAGISMTPREFDRAEFVEGNRYEVIHGVLVVSPIPSPNERDPNGELEFLLRTYRQLAGSTLDRTLTEHTIKTKSNRRRADRVIWAGLGRRPRMTEKPTIVVEFVSAGKRDRRRDYVEKREEYLAIGVREYWIIDRFERTMTVFTLLRGRVQRKTIQESQTYSTPLLPGFILPLAQVLAQSDWEEVSPELEEL